MRIPPDIIRSPNIRTIRDRLILVSALLVLWIFQACVSSEPEPIRSIYTQEFWQEVAGALSESIWSADRLERLGAGTVVTVESMRYEQNWLAVSFKLRKDSVYFVTPIVAYIRGKMLHYVFDEDIVYSIATDTVPLTVRYRQSRLRSLLGTSEAALDTSVYRQTYRDVLINGPLNGASVGLNIGELIERHNAASE